MVGGLVGRMGKLIKRRVGMTGELVEGPLLYVVGRVFPRR